MAKMFYTLEEAASKLGKSAEEVRGMAQSGQLQEFRDRDKLVFKKEQVDLLAGGDRDDSIKLADSGEIALAPDDSKGGSAAAGGTKDKSGISIFEADEAEDVDPMAQTQITQGAGGATVGDPGASGSGLLDLTREADDTSLGAGLLEDVYGGKPAASEGSGAGGDAGGSGESGALFESAGVASDVSSGAGAPLMMAVAEPYDGTWSGVTGGLALGMIAVLGTMLFCVLMAILGVPGAGLISLFASNLWMYVGIMAGAVLLLGVVGLFVGKKS
jgi:hypothetical protein